MQYLFHNVYEKIPIFMYSDVKNNDTCRHTEKIQIKPMFSIRNLYKKKKNIANVFKNEKRKIIDL